MKKSGLIGSTQAPRAFEFSLIALVALMLCPIFTEDSQGQTDNVRGDQPGFIRGVELVFNTANSHWYKRFDYDDGFGWHMARDSAVAWSGYLATVTSAQENNFVLQFCYPNSPGLVVYFGGTDEQQEGDWEWVTGESWNFSNWNLGTFDNQNGQQHYLVVLPGGWDDAYAYYPHPLSDVGGPVSFVVEWDCSCPYKCDYDEDNFLTAPDLSALIDVLFTGRPEEQDRFCPKSRGDFDCDGFPTALDLGGLIDHLFAGGDGPCDPCAP